MNPDTTSRRIIALAAITSLAVTLIATLYPILAALGVPSPREAGWVATQSFCVMLPAIVVALVLSRCLPRVTVIASSALILVVPILMFLDAVTHHWIQDRFLSRSIWRIVTDLRGSLAGHVSVTMIITAMAAILGLSMLVAILLWLSEWITRRWENREPSPATYVVLGGLAGIAFVISVPALVNINQTWQDMAAHPSRHPLCVLRLVKSPSAVPSAAGTPEHEISTTLERFTRRQDDRHRQLSVVSEATAREHPDVVVVVVESFRHELVSEEVMPNLWQLSQKGIHCRAHFSGGNATTHGMFSLVNGLEAIWYDRPVKFTPLLNRLFRQAGYEIGFFAGHDVWREFYMDGFVNKKHFDRFEVAPANGLASDRRATELTSLFLDRRDTTTNSRPRLAILYLYATHATYNSYSEDQQFQPAADDRLIYPYSAASQPGVWNRYKNSARTVDRFLSAIIDDNRIVIVTGDHGEAFLEDGTIGHGIRISEHQNMTPAVIYVPGRTGKEIQLPTSHADLLPTLLSAAKLSINDPRAFDGVDLLEATPESLADRIFATRNYLHEDVALIGPWTENPALPFAYRVQLSKRLQVTPLDAIDRRGDPITDAAASEIQNAAAAWWDAHQR